MKTGDVIAEIETDKATMEVEAVDDGRVGKILVPEGTEHVKVNAPIATLLTDGEDPSRSQGRSRLSTSPHGERGSRAPALLAPQREEPTRSRRDGRLTSRRRRPGRKQRLRKSLSQPPRSRRPPRW